MGYNTVENKIKPGDKVRVKKSYDGHNCAPIATDLVGEVSIWDPNIDDVYFVTFPTPLKNEEGRADTKWVYYTRDLELVEEGTSGAKKEAKETLKPDHSLIPQVLLDMIAYALMEGEQKYGRYNYLDGFKISELTSALSRHLKAYEAGEEMVPDSKYVPFHHIGAMGANLAMLAHNMENGTLTDNRFKIKGE